MLRVLENLGAIRRKTAAGVELIFSAEGFSINLCLLKKKKESLVTETAKTRISSVKELALLIKEDLPLYLVLNGKGIIHKEIPNSTDQNKDNLIVQLLPDADPDEFYLQQFQNGSKGSSILSIIRKDQVGKVLDEFEKAGLSVVHCSLGPMCVSHCRNLLFKETTQVNLADQNLSWNSDGALQLSQSSSGQVQSSIGFGNNEVKSESIVSFSAAFSHFFSTDSVSVDIGKVVASKGEFTEKRIFTIGKWSLVIGFFTIVVISLLLFMHYRSEYAALYNDSWMATEKMQQVETLQEEFRRKKELLEKTNMLSSSKISFYADRLAESVPESINLNLLEVYPLAGKIRSEYPAKFNHGKIAISGITKESSVLNEWLKTIHGFSWVKDVTISNYEMTKNNNKGEFELSIVI